MKINFTKEAMDKLMSLARHSSNPPHEVIDNLLKNIEFEEALSYVYEKEQKNSKKE